MENYGLTVTPYEYQKEGIRKGLEWKRMLIGDEPGLGKTLQSIGIVHSANAYPALVICPASLKINWQREWERFTGRKALILSNATAPSWSYMVQMHIFDVVICNYESLRKYFVFDIKGDRKNVRLANIIANPAIKMFRSLIVDESHRVKDSSAQQTVFTKMLSIGREYVLLLSGTPVVNKPSDLLTQLSIIGRLAEFGGMGQFLARYEIDGKGANLEELKQKLYETCMVRREKRKVLTELPDKTRVDLVVPIGNKEEYETCYNSLKKYLEVYTECEDWEIRRKMRMEMLVRFMTLRSLSGKGKVDAVIDFVRTFTDGGQKIVLFCSLHDIVDRLRGEFGDERAAFITGRESATQKQEAVDRFQTDAACTIAVCSIKAAGVGLTLTAASTVCFIEFPWTYSDCCQCEDRCHRIGQKENVTCYYMIGDGTIDGRLYGIIQDKRSVAAQIVGEGDEIPTEKAYFDEIINILK